MNKCRIFDEDYGARTTHYKSLSYKKGIDQSRGKPYVTSADKGKQRVSDGKKTSEGGAPTTVKCFKYGEQGHHANGCVDKVLRCYRCGKTGHIISECKNDVLTCFNYGEQSHINTQCQNPKKTTTTVA